MKKHLTVFTISGIALLGLMSCENGDDNDFPQAASLTVVHGAVSAPEVHVDYFGEELEVLDFSINPTLAFGSTGRFTIPADKTRAVGITYASDTTSVVLEDEVSLRAGEITSLFLLGDSLNLRSEAIETIGLERLNDSINAIRFINLTEDVASLNIGIQDSTVTLGSDLSFADPTDFIPVDATLENPNYLFTFTNEQDEVLASFNFEQYTIFDFPGFFFVQTLALRRNVTLALVGELDDGEGNSTLQVVRLNHFEE